MPGSAVPARTVLETLRQVLGSQQEPLPSESKKTRGAVAVLVKEEAEDLWLLMIRRRENLSDPWSGQMAFPGGHADPEDDTLFDTVARETTEEVGIDLRKQKFLGCLHNVQPKNAPMIVSPFVFLITEDVYPKTSREATEILWVPISFVLERKNVTSVIVPIGQKEVTMGCYRYSNHVIWGMSFRIIQEITSRITSHLKV